MLTFNFKVIPIHTVWENSQLLFHLKATMVGYIVLVLTKHSVYKIKYLKTLQRENKIWARQYSQNIQGLKPSTENYGK